MKNGSLHHNSPFVSLIIPCRNEKHYIARCLASIAAQDYPPQKMEVLIIDGASEDRTKTIAAQFIRKYPFMRILDNQKKIVPSAMNRGIRQAKGEVIMKIDAHAAYPSSYVSSCVANLINLNADNVGGILITKPAHSGMGAKAIARSLSHVFGIGSSPFRKNQTSKKPREVDTVAFGCYRRSVFEKIGLYNENLTKSSDMELNIRLKNAGGKIMLAPTIFAYYYADPTFKKFWNHNFIDGVWATYPIKFTRLLLRPRHFIPLAFVAMLFLLLFISPFWRTSFEIFLLMLGAYILASLAASLSIAFKEKNLAYLFLMPLAFAARHFAYGIGSLWGIVKLAF